MPGPNPWDFHGMPMTRRECDLPRLRDLGSTSVEVDAGETRWIKKNPPSIHS
jgi:hypothetical protein